MMAVISVIMTIAMTKIAITMVVIMTTMTTPHGNRVSRIMMIVLHSSCVDGNCNHDDDHRHHDKDDSDRDEMALLMETECIETK